jgi:hypothetical protein
MTVSGNSTILTVPLAFRGAFTGPKNIYMYAVGPNGNTGWVQKGTYSVVAGGVPVANSISPSSGTGGSQPFSFVMSDNAGSNFLVAGAMLFTKNPGFALTNSCYIIYDRNTNRFSMFNDAVTGSGSIVIGSTGSLSNSQCTLHGTGSSAAIGATTITITLNLSFSPSFAGSKNSFLFASENGFNTGWVQVGSWTVPGIPPTVGALSPASGNGLIQNFTASVSTAVSPTDVTKISMLFSPSASTVNACYVEYNRATATIGLYNNAGTVVSTKPIGASSSLQNTQCAIGYSVANYSGATVSLTVQIVFFSPAFAGAKTAYVESSNIWGSSGWLNRGSWTVP